MRYHRSLVRIALSTCGPRRGRGGRPGNLAPRAPRHRPLRGPLLAEDVDLPDPDQHRQDPRERERRSCRSPRLLAGDEAGSRPRALPAPTTPSASRSLGRAPATRPARGAAAQPRDPRVPYARRSTRCRRVAADRDHGFATSRVSPRGGPPRSGQPRATSGCSCTAPARACAARWRGTSMAEPVNAPQLSCQRARPADHRLPRGTLSLRDRRRFEQHINYCQGV